MEHSYRRLYGDVEFQRYVNGTSKDKKVCFNVRVIIWEMPAFSNNLFLC